MDDQVLESKHVGAESTLKDILQRKLHKPSVYF